MPFKGLVFTIDGGRQSYFPNNPEFHALLSKTPSGKALIDNYKRQRRIAKPLALLGAAMPVADLL
ncbi:MAG TPA: hypothetical protein ENN84_01110 [Candidatus Marinimicrobia bacterium]|nr:hypothetical protein [Candidatus Neomarinimicrobiota bacterium]